LFIAIFRNLKIKNLFHFVGLIRNFLSNFRIALTILRSFIIELVTPVTDDVITVELIIVVVIAEVELVKSSFSGLMTLSV
jgi:hypothetical protein